MSPVMGHLREGSEAFGVEPIKKENSSTPWQVLRADPSTCEGHPGGYDYLLFVLRGAQRPGTWVD